MCVFIINSKKNNKIRIVVKTIDAIDAYNI